MAAFSALDLVIFFGSLIAVMGAGLWVSRKESSAADFYLAGRGARWWGVAASIFGSNVSANHVAGMMGIGFSVGFAQSHFEFSAIAGLLILCYLFLPVYRKLKLYTLSEYLSRRYNDTSRIAYALIVLVIIVGIQMVPAFYIGSRALNILLQQGVEDIDGTSYIVGIVLMAVVAGTYTIVGGLRAVIVTDVIQSILVLIAGILVCVLTFSLPEIGGWAGMRALDADGRELMHLYLPSNDPNLPWSGVLGGLFVLHFFYWGTNQFIVQRALAARTDREGRLGIIVAGFFKLLIPFFSIGTGVAAYYLFLARGLTVPDPDAVFPELMKQVVTPLGYGLAGIVAAGLIGAILSSIDSMLNSAATIVTFDFYKKYLKPSADERELILVGRIAITVFIVVSALLAILIMDPNSKENFFLGIASHQAKLVAGLVVAFAVGMVWKRATAAGAMAAIATGILLSYLTPAVYASLLPADSNAPSELRAIFGSQLNFMHNVVVAAGGALVVQVVVSLLTQPDLEKGKLTWTELGGHDPSTLRRVGSSILVTIILMIVLACLMVGGTVSPTLAALLAGLWTAGVFVRGALQTIRAQGAELTAATILKEDRCWAGVLAGLAMGALFYFY